mgnify:CR=1 FL=1
MENSIHIGYEVNSVYKLAENGSPQQMCSGIKVHYEYHREKRNNLRLFTWNEKSHE